MYAVPASPHTPAVWLVDSYHVSRQNTSTGRLTAAMFDAVLELVRQKLVETDNNDRV
jgi:uracil-DNA glycosylase